VGSLVTNALSDAIADALQDPKGWRLQALFNRAVQDERLVAIALCSDDGDVVHSTSAYPRSLDCEKARDAAARPDPQLRIEGGSVHVGMHRIAADSGAVADLVLLHDLSFIDRRSQDTRRYLIVLIGALGATMALVTVIVAQLSWRGWVRGARALLRGEGLLRPINAERGELAPFVADLRTRLRDLEDEYRRYFGPETDWNPERLRSLLRTQLRGDQVIVVSNREPYIHDRSADGVIVRRPASGLVTAVEPVMRACSGTWIAHGGGSADRQVVDRHDCIAVPPGSDTYTLRRLWLTPEEEKGYYYGFANEGLWPLCHVAHVRPVFRENDWDCYRLVNQRFADAVVEQARSEDPVVLVQDYHFALLPALVRQRAPTRDHPDFLAYPLAESRVFRHLPVAPGDPPGNAWQHDPRLSHALSLQELHRDGRSISGSAYRA
jgi:trehalose 6-phosphate synthase